MSDTPAPRTAQSVSVDGTTVSFLSPDDQAKEDRRQVERRALKRTKSLAGFFRIFKINTSDRP